MTDPAGSSAEHVKVRRLDGEPVVNPLEGVPGPATVAMTNPVFPG